MHECIVRTFLAPKAAKGVTIFVPLSLDSFISLSEALNPTLDLDNPFKIIKISIRVGQLEPKILCLFGEIPHPAKMAKTLRRPVRAKSHFDQIKYQNMIGVKDSQ